MDTEGLEEFRGTERFAIERRLGAGGFGVVYRALDRKRDAVVALKLLSRGDSDALYRFKQEFRSLADISHPNLVSLYELLSEDGQWFFTMELVEGTNFLEYVQGLRCGDGTPSDGRTPSAVSAPLHPSGGSEADGPTGPGRPGSTAADTARLWGALSQLGEGLNALHAAGKLHRDIKPSNVLVTGEGRLVLLDFGLVSELSKDGVLHSIHLVGTPAYMSPEQAAGRPVTAASDWYGVGVMLYEALTGVRPFPGQYLDVLVQKQESEPPPPSDLSPSIPDELDALCRSLLRRDPRDRPGEEQILHTLRTATRRSTAPSPRERARAAPFVGRGRELEALNDAFLRVRDGVAVVVFVEGLAGVGKTALVRRFLDGLRERDPDLVVLAGRCFEQETVPYKALDSLVDALSNYLKRLPASEVEALLPRDLLPLSRVFPVLKQVEAVAAARRRVVAIPDSQELRRRAFGALRELLSRLSDRVPLVLFIDDLQWGDADSAALLPELLRPPDPPGLLLLACCRSEDVVRSSLVAALRGLPAAGSGLELDDRRIEELAPEEARGLARALLEGSGGEAGASVEAVARESRGNPLFIDELARHVRSLSPDRGGGLLASGGVRLEDVIWERIARLPDDARRLLATVAVAGRPLDRAVARRAAELSEDDQPALAVLRAGHLVRGAASEAEDHIEIYHDLIRGTILERLTESDKEASHQRLALALETASTPDAESLAVHYEAAGAKERAAVYAADAAAKAAEALAFDRAARLYKQALELGTADAERRQRLRVRLADALSNAGRGEEAGRAYLAAVDGAEPSERLELQRRAAEQFLRSGHLDEGLAVLKRVLDQIGMRLAPTPRMALLSYFIRLVQLRLRGLTFRERAASEIPAEELVRIDTCWSASQGLSFMDTIRGRDFQMRHMLIALRAGEPYRVARAFGNEAGYAAMPGWPAHRRTQRLVTAALSLARRVNHPHALAVAHIGAGVAAYLEGRWREAWELGIEAETRLRDQCTGVAFELDMVHVYSLRALFFLGRLREIAERLPRLLNEATERADRYAEISLRTRHSHVVNLIADRPDRARRDLRVGERWSHQGYRLQRYFQLVAQTEVALYGGEPETARRSLLENWRTLKGSLIIQRVQFFRIEWLHLRARTALAVVAGGTLPPARRNALLRTAAEDARRIARERVHWGQPFADLLRAGCASLADSPSLASDLLAAARTGFEAADMALYAAAARRCRGLLIGGEEGAKLVAEADAWMTGEGIRRPDRMTAMLAPGRWA